MKSDKTMQFIVNGIVKETQTAVPNQAFLFETDSAVYEVKPKITYNIKRDDFAELPKNNEMDLYCEEWRIVADH